MDEVGGALIAICARVLIAVFLPTAFITGLQGTFYKQFAITIAASPPRSRCLRVADAFARDWRRLLLKSHALSHVEKARPGLMDRLAMAGPLVLPLVSTGGFDRAVELGYGGHDGAR